VSVGESDWGGARLEIDLPLASGELNTNST
jgi:hypothetical protein